MGECNSSFVSHAHIDLIYHRIYLDKYKTCKSAEEVSAMQDAILAELQSSYEESRKDKDKG